MERLQVAFIVIIVCCPFALGLVDVKSTPDFSISPFGVLTSAEPQHRYGIPGHEARARALSTTLEDKCARVASLSSPKEWELATSHIRSSIDHDVMFSSSDLKDVWVALSKPPNDRTWRWDEGSGVNEDLWCKDSPRVEEGLEGLAYLRRDGDAYCLVQTGLFGSKARSILLDYSAPCLDRKMRFAVTIRRIPGYSHSKLFEWIAETFHYGLLEAGYDSILTDSLNEKGRTYIIMACHLIPILPGMFDLIPRDAILYQMEQVSRMSENDWWTEDYVKLLRQHVSRGGRIWDYSSRNVGMLKELYGITARHVPIGYSSPLSRIPKGEEDIDVLFYGAMNDRRMQILQALEARGLVVKFVYRVFPPELDDWISRSKIVLNVHFYEAKIIEVARISYLLFNQKCVISESGADPAENALFSKGIVFADDEALIDTVVEYSKYDEKRRMQELAGYAMVSAQKHSNILKDVLSSR